MATNAAVSCENLSTLGARRRRTLGLVGAAGAVAWFAGLVAVRAPAIAFVTIALPAWSAAMGILQARERTCVRLAALGVAETDDAPRKVEGDELVAIRAKAGRINRRAILIALVIGALAILLGGIARGITIQAS